MIENRNREVVDVNTVWLLVTVVAGIFEAITTGLISLWFVIGGIVAFVLSLFGFNTLVQSIAFITVSVLSMIALRPFIAKGLASKKTKTNVDRLIGRGCLVTQRIDNLNNMGEVMVDGQRWSAKTKEDDCIIEEGEKVEIEEVVGVKLIIRRCNHPDNNI